MSTGAMQRWAPREIAVDEAVGAGTSTGTSADATDEAVAGDPSERRGASSDPLWPASALASAPTPPPAARSHAATAPMTAVASPSVRRDEDDDDDDSHAALGPIGLLLRDPAEVARRCLEEEGLRALTLASLGALGLGAAVFGGVVGSFRGGEQILYGALKVPLAMIFALVVCVPAFHAVAASLGRAWPLRTVVALTVASAGRASLVLLAFAPVLWLAYDLGLGYHAAALGATGAYAMAGLGALGVLLRGLGDSKHRLTTAIAFVAVFLAAAGQTGWMLRPYLVRPRTEDVPFVRAREGGFADALYVSARSALGVYDASRAASVDARQVAECDLVTPPAGGWPPGSRCAEAGRDGLGGHSAPDYYDGEYR